MTRRERGVIAAIVGVCLALVGLYAVVNGRQAARKRRPLFAASPDYLTSAVEAQRQTHRLFEQYPQGKHLQ